MSLVTLSALVAPLASMSGTMRLPCSVFVGTAADPLALDAMAPLPLAAAARRLGGILAEAMAGVLGKS